MPTQTETQPIPTFRFNVPKLEVTAFDQASEHDKFTGSYISKIGDSGGQGKVARLEGGMVLP